jgi:hypothetical protein
VCAVCQCARQHALQVWLAALSMLRHMLPDDYASMFVESGRWTVLLVHGYWEQRQVRCCSHCLFTSVSHIYGR